MKAWFTLIELMVVVAIIAILASLLLPSLGAAREKGKSMKCVCNLKQYGTAMAMYADDCSEWLPLLYDGSSGYSLIYKRALFLEYYIGKPVKQSDANGDYVLPPGMVCANYKSTTGDPMEIVGGKARLYGYGINGQGLNDANGITFTPNSAYRLPKVKNASAKLLAIEVNTWWSSHSMANPALLDSDQKIVYRRHLGNQSNAVFFDGHVFPLRSNAIYASPRQGKDCWDVYDAK